MDIDYIMSVTRGDGMNNRRKKRNQKIIIGIISVFILISMFSFFVGKNQSSLGKFLSTSVQTVEYYLVKKPLEFVSGIFSEYYELKDVYDENELLKEKLDSYASLESENEVLTSEMNKLKEISEIDYLPTEYKTKVAGVQTRDQTNWNDEIIIDSGSQSEIEEGMVVCDSKGMIGTVTSVNELTATVSLLTCEKPASKIPVMILNGEETIYGLIEGYDVNNGYLEMTLLSKIDKLEKDAKVYTSGLGGDGKSPKGIYIGKAKKLYTNSDGTTTLVRVKAAADFDDLSYVVVVKKVN